MNKKICKIVVAGDGGTGKTTFISTRKQKNFLESSKITIGVDFACFPVEIHECHDQKMMFLIFDLGGQKRFQFMHSSYIIGSRAAIILYDLTRPKSFENISYWHTILQKENPYIPIVIGGTKKDLAQQDDISHFIKRGTQLFRTLPNSEYILDHIFISSKTYEGVEKPFHILGKTLLTKPEIIARQQIFTASKLN
jgi:small GTP-binding protein